MKNFKILKQSRFLIPLLLIMGCEPIENREDMGLPIAASDLQFSVTQTSGYDNQVILESQTPGVVPFWDYGPGISNKQRDTIILPFAGEYNIRYTAYSQGGPIADSVQITVSQNDPAYFSAAEWEYLSNGIDGKTWVLDMGKPIGWYGLDYGAGAGDDWSWHPDYAGNEWVMANRNWGEMNFNLNGNANYTRVFSPADGEEETCSCTFDLRLDDGEIILSDCGMLFGGDYLSHASNWNTLKIFELTEDVLMLGVLRDNPTAGGAAYIVFRFIPK